VRTWQIIEEFQRQAATGQPYQVASLVVITSTAAIFSPAVKDRWIQAFPSAIITDSIGSTETGFQGVGLQDKSTIGHDGVRVTLGPDSVVIDDGNRILDLASSVGVVGRLGRTGNVPVGYCNDPEEVEAAIKAHPAVYDSLVVGIPDEKYGQAVAAVVELREGQALDLAGLRTFLSTGLAGYKLPRSMTLVDQVPRNPAGKAQYPRALELALARDTHEL